LVKKKKKFLFLFTRRCRFAFGTRDGFKNYAEMADLSIEFGSTRVDELTTTTTTITRRGTPCRVCVCRRVSPDTRRTLESFRSETNQVELL